MITIKATKIYKERKVLDVDFTFEQGKIYAVIGANGSGKSTLLKIIAGIIKPTNGNCSFDKNINVSFMPQNTYLFDLSLKANVKTGIPKLKFFSREKNYYNKRINELSDKLELTPFLHKNANKLSGGEMQKTALARSLISKHDLLLLDEPTSSLDINSTINAERVIKEYHETFLPTIILATHSINQAERLADTVLFMKNGKIVEVASADLFKLNPQTDELISFLKNS